MAPFDGFFTDILDDLKTYLENTYPTYNIGFGKITQGQFLSYSQPAIRIIFEDANDTGTMNKLWMFDVTVLYLKYDPKITDNYDILDEIEPMMDNLNTHLGLQNYNDLRMYGDVVGCRIEQLPHDESYIFAAAITLNIQRKEIAT